jgi:DNA-directed RNA polymerase specialized sigma24 family protein
MIAPADIKVEFLAEIPKLRAFATIFCGRRTVRADDLVQETLIRAQENGGSFGLGSNLVAWCFASERNCDLVLKGHMNFRLALAELPPDHLEALTLVDGCGLHRAAFPMPRRKQSICAISDID